MAAIPTAFIQMLNFQCQLYRTFTSGSLSMSTNRFIQSIPLSTCPALLTPKSGCTAACVQRLQTSSQETMGQKTISSVMWMSFTWGTRKFILVSSFHGCLQGGVSSTPATSICISGARAVFLESWGPWFYFRAFSGNVSCGQRSRACFAFRGLENAYRRMF